MDLISPIVKGVLQSRRTSPYPHFAVFDFDGTFIYNDCAEATLNYMARCKFPNARKYFDRYYSLLDSGDTRAAYRFGATTLQGLTAEQVDKIVRLAMAFERTDLAEEKLFRRTVARSITPRKNVVELARQLWVWGVDVWVVSASPELVVRPAMNYFSQPAKGIIGIRNIVKDGVVTGELEEPLSTFEGKVDCIKKYINPTIRPLIGVGDSMNDHPMLEYSEKRVVVDRGNELAALAKANDWFILP